MNKNVTFKGWYTGQDGTGTKVTKNTYWDDTYGTTLYADWKDLYVITYDANGGFFGTGTNKTPTYIIHKAENSKYTKPGSTPNKDGYTLEGWYDAPTGGNRILLGDPNYLINQDTTIYAHWVPVTFKVEVPTVGNTTWTQKATATSGSLTGYKITYYISEINENDENAITQTSRSVSGKAEVSTYYVWAIATKGSVPIKSNNYVMVETGHTHIGKSSAYGGCYTKNCSCKQSQGFLVWFENTGEWTRGRISSGTRYCKLCGIKLDLSNMWQSSSYADGYIRCLECEAFTKQDFGSWYGYLCPDCYPKLGTVFENAPTFYHMGNGSAYIRESSITHQTEYEADCHKTARNGFSTSIDF